MDHRPDRHGGRCGHETIGSVAKVLGMRLAKSPADEPWGNGVHRRRAALEFRQVLAVIRHERKPGRATPELAQRAAAIVDKTAIAIEPEADEPFLELLDFIRRELDEIRSGER